MSVQAQHGKTVLVIDDEPDFAVLVASILRLRGFTVTTANDLSEALALINENKPDLVVLDVTMTHLTGRIGLAHALRPDEHSARTPLIIISGVDNDCYARTQAGDGSLPCDRFLTKPLDSDDLIRAACDLMRIPTVPSEAEEPGPVQDLPPVAARTRKTVLVVEDDSDFAALLTAILRRGGHSVAVSSDGDTALNRVREMRPDVITLDIQMPNKNGLMFFRQLRSDEAFRRIPIIVVTGLTRDDRETENFIHSFLGVDHLPHPEAYLEKPVDEGELLRVIEQVT